MGRETTILEDFRGFWNSEWSSEMRRDSEEHLWRRQKPGKFLTLMNESLGSEAD